MSYALQGIIAYIGFAIVALVVLARWADCWPPKRGDLRDRGALLLVLLAVVWPATVLVAAVFSIAIALALGDDDAQGGPPPQ